MNTTTETASTLRPGWGLNPPAEATVAWGARAIYREPVVDLVWDRQAAAGDTRAKRVAFCKNAVDPMLAVARKAIQAAPRALRDPGQVLLAVEGDAVLYGDTKASSGYLYLGAWQLPAASTTKCSGEDAAEAIQAVAFLGDEGWLDARIEDGQVVFSGSPTGEHSLDLATSDGARVVSHWRGYCEAACRAVAATKPQPKRARRAR